MNAYVSLIRINLRLAFREKSVLFFTYVFPVLFFFGFGQISGMRSTGDMARTVSMVLVVGVLGNGLFGAGIRAVVERETGVLRRYKVAPIGPGPILGASIVTGWLLYLPTAALIVGLSSVVYRMPLPASPFAFAVIVTLGCMSFRAIGLIVASVANSIAESNVLTQLVWLPMLFLSGVTLPISMMPVWLQITSQFLPASYLNTAMQHVLLDSANLRSELWPAMALIASTIVAVFISKKLFRWEKDEKIPARAKVWVLAAFVPFLALGGYQGYNRGHIVESKRLERQMRRLETHLIRGARIFAEKGKVIEQGAVLIRDGKIAEVFEGAGPDPEALRAEPLEAVGKTILPGLIDVHVHLGSPGGVADKSSTASNASAQEAAMRRELSAYLYTGVVAVRSVGDFTSAVLRVKRQIQLGQHTGAELFVTGPIFTAPGGHGTELFQDMQEAVKTAASKDFVRTPSSEAEAREMVHALKLQHVDGIKVALDRGAPGHPVPRLNAALVQTIAAQAHADSLPLIVHTGDGKDVAEAVRLGAASIEHGSMRERIPAEVFAEMKTRGIMYVATLSLAEAISQLKEGRADVLSRTLLEQVAPPGMVASTRRAVLGGAAGAAWRSKAQKSDASLEIAMENLRAAWTAGVPLATGSDAGNMLVIHGPTAQHEMQLWVKAGIPPAIALQAATYNAAKLLGVESRLGKIQRGYDASLVLVDGNPLVDISATERVSGAFLQGERLDRPGLFHQR